MDIQTVTYAAIGKKFYLKKGFQSISVDDHMKTMLADGWTILSGPVFVPGKKAPGLIGSQTNRGAMMTTYQRP